MEYVRTRNGVPIPMVGLGTWDLRNQECIDSVKYALSCGYRHIDTAAMYQNEKQIGVAIQQSDISRSDIFITTKVWRSDLGRSFATRSFEDSLDNLRTDYLDLFLIHWPGNSKKLRIETYGKMIEFRDEAKVKTIGVSNFSAAEIMEIHDAFGEYPAMNQIHFNPFHFDQEILDFCQQHNILITAYTPLNKGRGLNNPQIQQLASKYKKLPSQIVLRWFIDLGIVTIPKSSNPDHITTNFDIFDFSLTADEVNSLKNL